MIQPVAMQDFFITGGYFDAQNHPSFQSAMVWRWFFGLMTFAGLILLIWDLLTIGKGETRKMAVVEAE